MSTRRVATMTVDRDGKVVLANDVAREKFPGCVGKRCADVVKFKDANGSPVCNHLCWPALAATGGDGDVTGESTAGLGRLICVGLEGPDGAVGVVNVVPPKSPPPDVDVHLSEREREVVGQLVRGRSCPQIARRLGISASTVRTHVDRIKEKLGVRRSTELVSKALALELVDEP